MLRTCSTSRIHREVIQAKGHRGSNQKSARSRSGARSLLMTTLNLLGAAPIPERDLRDDMIPGMPGTNLTRDEARTRAALLSVDSYTVELDLTTSDKTFASTTTLAFTCREPGASTFVDLVGASVREITLNGQKLDPDAAYRNSRITLDDL